MTSQTDYTPSTAQVRADYSLDYSFQYDGVPHLDRMHAFDRWLARYRESVIDEVEDHLVRRDQFTERTLTVIDELR